MKDQSLDEISLIPFKGIWLFAVKKEITKLFGNEEIKFQMSIKGNKIILESQEISQNLEIQDRHLEPEAINAS